MLDEPQLDPMGSIVLEARADADLAALTGSRIRGFEPAPGDARGPGDYQAFVVIAALSVPIHPRVPVTWAEYGVSCYGSTAQNAWAVWAAFAKAFHATTPRVRASNGLGIYRTAVTSGGEQGTDPDTGQPVVRGSIQVIATAQAVTS
jgi:hypothetical protein